jgi:hypothetical protein
LEDKNYIVNSFLSSDEKKLFVTDKNFGVRIYDITNLAQPSLMSSIDVNKAYNSVLTKNQKYLYISTYVNGPYLYDISDIGNPIFTASVARSDQVRKVVISSGDTMIAIATGTHGVWYFPLTKDGIRESQKGYISSSTEFEILRAEKDATIFHTANDLVFSSDGKKLYIAALNQGVMIVDIDRQKIIARIKTKNALNVTLSKDDRTLFISDFDDGMKVYDVSGY